MATIVYTLSAKIDKTTGKQEILVRFFHGRFNQRGKTNLWVQAQHWDQEKQTLTIPKIRVMSEENKAIVKDLQRINAELKEIEQYLHQAFLDAGAGKLPLPPKWVNEKLQQRLSNQVITEIDSDKEDLFKAFERFVATQNVSHDRKRQYNVILRALRRYEIYSGDNIDFETLSADFLRDFYDYYASEHQFVKTDEEGKPYIADPLLQQAYDVVPECRLPKPRGGNTLYGFMSRLHTFIHWAIKNDFLTKDPFDNYDMGTSVYGTPFYLTKEERNQLYAATFPDNPGLEVQRDIFVFHCFIGCRVGDLMKMTRENIIDGAIEYIPRKTKEGRPWIVRVPITPTAQEILDRYADHPGKKLLPFICEQDYNRDIKKMLRLAGIDRMVTTLNTLTREEEKHPIWEVASSHMARRVLIGNLYKEVKDPNLIAKISGHVENSRAFARYRDIDEEMAKETILKLE